MILSNLASNSISLYRTMKVVFAIILFHSFCFICQAQDILDITDQTLKIGGNKEEELYFAFAEGDRIVFNFQEIDKKELTEIEILEYPSNSKFSDFKTNKIDGKTIVVPRNGVYIFRFKNSAITGRICKIKIQRIPGSDASKNFNTAVKWITKQDTVWNSYTKDVIISYDTSYVQKTKKELVKVDTIVTQLLDKVIRVHSETAAGKTQYPYMQQSNCLRTSLPQTSIIHIKLRKLWHGLIG